MRKNKGSALKKKRNTSGCLRQRTIVILLFWVLYVLIPTILVRAEKVPAMSGTSRTGPGHSIILAKAIFVKYSKLYYENTIKEIIRTDCGRCHSGTTRNLMDYDSLKAYADAGLLATMVQGPMRRFAGNDAQIILKWNQGGAPEKPPAAQAQFCPTPGAGSPVSAGQITYRNTVRNIVAKDCLRCHNGHFRNLTTYKNVKMYVDNGLLQKLVLPGGPMHRFAGPDTRQIIAWINTGAPR